MASILHRFRKQESGVVAILFGIAIIPIMLLVGAGVDYARLSAAQAAAQAAADAAALAAAASRIETEASMSVVATNYLRANTTGTNADATRITTFRYDTTKREVTLIAEGSISPAFMQLAGYSQLGYRVTANSIRALNGSTELVLVLDNTWSMSGSKLAALKDSAAELVTTLWRDPSVDVKIGVVPYADYVNVGTANRNATWVSVPADYDVTSQRTCVTKTTRSVCIRGPAKTCTRTIDGNVETYDCTPSTCTEQTVPPYESCSGGGTTRYRWYGCVGSRTSGTLRLTDAQPSTPYPGYLATSQNCLNPIIPLSTSPSTVTAAIRGMVVNVGGYKPSTYIPGGLIWGVNVLSPTAPFSEGRPYDSQNRRPRKVMVLMTDGANTLQFRASDGRHVAFNGNTNNQAKQLAQTYSDMDAICTYAKSQQIEIYTIAFDITDPTARTAMRSCASSSAHAFDATDRTSLQEVFKNIAQSLQNVRLTR
ncbi:MAG: pilus assembly protein TadG-related protein [Proteobacteria bacterium]|nr:pilus assembly protein TadG-related protein [Pseudomonadota bacterium]